MKKINQNIQYIHMCKCKYKQKYYFNNLDTQILNYYGFLYNF